ncbi:MAG: mechanosensitive ion channel [Ktedonobacteraceae bacterium]|nr:mechanosensitive ion channel [Ktedonobacteraceae bacterium]
MTFQPVLLALTQTITAILNFIPHLINGLIIFILGYIISALVRWIMRFIFRRIRLEQIFQRVGIDRVLQGLGVRIAVSDILVQIVFFFLILSFSTSAVQLMGLTAVATLLQNVLSFIPQAISAGLIIIFGSMIARFLGGTITSVAQSVNISYSNALGKIIEYAIVAFVMVLAISTLGVNTTILTTSLTIIIAAAGLAIALTFAFGSRDAARHVIAGFYVRQNFVPGQRVQLGDQSGTIRGTAGAYTVLDTVNTTGQRATISLPNALLLQSGVLSQAEETPLPSTEVPRPETENPETGEE